MDSQEKTSNAMKIPGLVDVQVNGYKGVDFSSGDLTKGDCIAGCREMLEAGTTAFLPTMISCDEDVYKQNLPILADVVSIPEFQGRLLGIHIEGPFISAEAGTRGAHNSEWIRPPDIGLLEKLIGWSNERIKL